MGLIVITRLVLVFNPIGINFEVFRNKKAYQQMADIADGRPVIFDGKYAIAAKYAFYTGKETFSQPNVSHRTSQWQYRDDDSGFVGRDVIIEVDPARYSEQEAKQRVKCAELANGREVYYVELSDFHPTRLVEIESNLVLPEEVKRGERFDFVLTINNPYAYDIEVDGKQLVKVVAWYDNEMGYSAQMVRTAKSFLER